VKVKDFLSILFGVLVASQVVNVLSFIITGEPPYSSSPLDRGFYTIESAILLLGWYHFLLGESK
jgi:hypothetical protein